MKQLSIQRVLTERMPEYANLSGNALKQKVLEILDDPRLSENARVPQLKNIIATRNDNLVWSTLTAYLTGQNCKIS